MTPQTDTKKIRKAIRRVLEDKLAFLGNSHENNYLFDDLENSLTEAIKSLNAPKEKRVTKLPPGSLAFKVASGMDVTAQDVAEYNDENVKKWKYRDQFPEPMLPLADLCAEYFGDPRKKDLMLWLGEISDWLQVGCIQDDFKKSVIAAKKWPQPPVSPASLTKTIRSFAMQRKRRRGLEHADSSPSVSEADRNLAEEIRAERAGL